MYLYNRCRCTFESPYLLALTRSSTFNNHSKRNWINTCHIFPVNARNPSSQLKHFFPGNFPTSSLKYRFPRKSRECVHRIQARKGLKPRFYLFWNRQASLLLRVYILNRFWTSENSLKHSPFGDIKLSTERSPGGGLFVLFVFSISRTRKITGKFRKGQLCV